MNAQPRARTATRYASRIGTDAALLLLALVVFAQLAGAGFLHFDDTQFVTENALVRGGISLDGLSRVWTSSTQGNWVPLATLSHMLDVQLFALRPAGHHLVNLLFHLLSTVLLYRLLLSLTGARLGSAFAAALFAVHPVQVEVVAWISQRRTVLMMFFWLLTLHAYRRYVGRPAAGRYLLVAALFVGGLLSKALIVMLPLVLLLLDYWPLGRWRSLTPVRRRWWLVLEKAPLLALAAVNGVITIQGQARSYAFALDDRVGIVDRAAHALVAGGWYLAKLFLPTQLAIFYPYPLQGDPLIVVVGAGLLLAGITAAAFLLARRRPYLPVGWLWFLVTLLPVIGLIQAGEQAYADRYLYVPLIGWALALIWGGADLGSRTNFGRALRPALAAAVLVALSAACFVQVRYWKNESTLFTHALAATGGSHVVHNQLGCIDLVYGRTDAAVEHFRAALAFAPDYLLAHQNLGLAYTVQGKHQEAQVEYGLARKYHP